MDVDPPSTAPQQSAIGVNNGSQPFEDPWEETINLESKSVPILPSPTLFCLLIIADILDSTRKDIKQASIMVSCMACMKVESLDKRRHGKYGRRLGIWRDLRNFGLRFLWGPKETVQRKGRMRGMSMLMLYFASDIYLSEGF